ncbi:MAG: MoxR family ATPase [Candidatus Thermoplasmatota archaeon]|nr:MoxR family ATPase [Candidatus Thermoplasmatota archaeon]MCL5730798.1 MoxR family ATPase [Candidatus Thermoplasmatota archaeon]
MISTGEEIDQDFLKAVRDKARAIQDLIGKRVIGSERIVRFMLISLISENHILLEGVPGLAKTMLASEFANYLGLPFKRIQFTPDMLPSDITGSMVFNLETRKMEFRKGPIFANIVLADELNRTPPKVQSALLESMEEKQVSAGGVSEKLPQPFLVIATQNPIEQEGTFPLAEALMDRFLFRYFMTYPDKEEELMILEDSSPIKSEGGGVRLTGDEIMNLRVMRDSVFASDRIKNYIVEICRATRNSDKIYLGASPRTTGKFYRAAKASALLSGRSYVIPEDVKSIAFELLNHRLILNSEAVIEAGPEIQKFIAGLIDSFVSSVKVPE